MAAEPAPNSAEGQSSQPPRAPAFVRQSPRGRSSSAIPPPSPPARIAIFDGKAIRRRMHDDAAFSAFLSHEFDRLDADGNEALSLGELKPALLRLGELLGLPPAGTARETDELVEGLFASFMSPDLTEEIGRETFVGICKDILRGASHALEEDPLSALLYDGGALRRIVGSAEEAEAVIAALFAELDADGSGRISRHELRPALVRLGLNKGDNSTGEALEHTERVLDRVIARYCEDGDGELSCEEFAALVVDISRELEAAPLYLPQRATVLNGAYIKKILSDDDFFTAVADAMFDDWDVAGKGFLVCSDALAGFRKLGLAYGLPPADAPEADKVYTSLFLSADVNMDGSVDKEEFRAVLRSLFVGMQLQLEEKPVVVESAVLSKLTETEVFDGQKILALLQENGGQRVRKFLEEKFTEMDEGGRGRLSREEVHLVLEQVEQMAGLPSPGRAGEVDRRVEAEFEAMFRGGEGAWEGGSEAGVGREEFVESMMRLLQRVGDTLHDDPILLFMADGAKMQRLMAEESEFATLVEVLFSSLDKDGSGTVSASELRPALCSMVHSVGMPFSARSTSVESLVAQLMMTHGHGRLDLNRDQFSAFVRDTVSDLAARLAAKPVYVAQEGQVLDGSKLRQILGNRRLFQRVCEDTFTSWDMAKKRCLTRADISAGLARSGMSWGLPPHNARHAEQLYERFFLKADLDRSGSIERAEFNVFMRGFFRSMADELEKNPVVVQASVVTT
ncbi:hypothetical protein CLOP_g16337 [Closterium sp. NIES-67]|nr:hypothetical protein CLOP_g16337 [Closterium sp. NIES-67]